MAEFDYHSRRLRARLLVLGSDPTASRDLVGRWAATAGRMRPAGPETLCLPFVPLVDLAGFDLEVEVEVEGSGRSWGSGVDASVLVVGASARRPHELFVLQRRARERAGSGPLLWAAHGGWSEPLVEAARRLGVEDDILRASVDSAAGACTCLEVALACLVDHILLRVHPANWGEGAPDSAVVVQRLREWRRLLGTTGPTAETEGPWRRRALELDGIEPLSASEAELEAQTLEQILKLTPAEAARFRRPDRSATETRRSGRGTRRR